MTTRRGRSPGRQDWLKREKRDHPKSRTRGEVRDLLGISNSTVDRWVREGKIPPAAYSSVSGWPLWSAEQVRELIERYVL